MANGYSRQIQERIGTAADGTVFVDSDFADIADTETIEQEKKPSVRKSMKQNAELTATGHKQAKHKKPER